MARTKRVKTSTEEEDEAFAKEAPVAYRWLWIKAPSDVTYNKLLNKLVFMEDLVEKIFVDEHTHSLYRSFEGQMTLDELAKFKASHELGQEFERLRVKERMMSVIEWKMDTMTMDELIKLETERKVDRLSWKLKEQSID